MSPDQTPPALGTPLTDAELYEPYTDGSMRPCNALTQDPYFVLSGFARTLERQLQASLAREAALEKALKDSYRFTSRFSGPRVNKLNRTISNLLFEGSSSSHD